MQRTLGIDGQLVFLRNSDDKVNALRDSFLGTIKAPSPITNPYFNVYTAAFEIKESR
jgi:hypothetical protein